jgi:Ca-activated chloride channel family protein
MSGWRFQEPLCLLLAVPIVLLAVLAARRQRQAAMLYSSVQLLAELRTTLALRCKHLFPWARLGGLLLLVAALAQPQYGLSEFRVRSEGIAIQMCIDRSGSMQALDFELAGKAVDRLTAVKDVFRKFVAGGDELPGREDDLIGLVAFGGYAEGKSPLTLDHGALLEVLESVEIPVPVRDSQERVINRRFWEEELATAIGDAVALAVDRLKDAEAKSKVVILLSDGESNAGVVLPPEAAQAAKNFGVKIYSIGVGRTGMAPFPDVDLFGRPYLTQQPVRLDEETLRMLAEETGGQYFNASDTETLERVYAEIDRLEKTQTEGRLYTEYREIYQWFMLPGLGLLLLVTVLSCTRFRSLP